MGKNKRRKLSFLPSTTESSGDPAPATGGGSGYEDPDATDSTRRTLAGSGDGDGGNLNQVPEAGGMGLHPLCMPEILTQIFKYCPPEDLATARLVCSTWEETSLPAWRSTAPLQFHYPGGKEIFLTSGEHGTDDEEEKIPIAEFLKFWKANLTKKPFRSFRLSKWEFALLGKKTTRGHTTGQFWNSIGGSITTLKLSGCSFTGARVLRKIIYQACPNLRELTLDGCTYPHRHQPILRNEPVYRGPEHGELGSLESLTISLRHYVLRRTGMLPVTWLELLSHFPGVKSLTLELVGRSYSDYYRVITELVNAIKLIRSHDGGKLPIKQFRIHMDSSTKRLRSLRRKHDSGRIFVLIHELILPVELNVFKINLTRDDMLAAMETIESSKTALQKLVALEEDGDVGTDDWGFPFGIELQNLEALAMSPRFCGSMGFLKYTPNLRELRIDGHGIRSLETDLISQTFQQELADVKLLNLKRFQFDFRVSNAELRSLVGWLPNVRMLTMHLTDKQFAIICKGWKELQYLHVLGGRLTDAGITGKGLTDPKMEGKKAGKPLRKRNISCLKGLKTFKIECGRRMLTDVSAFDGFLKLPKLRELTITTLKNKFGKEARVALRSKIAICNFL